MWIIQDLTGSREVVRLSLTYGEGADTEPYGLILTMLAYKYCGGGCEATLI